jgi:hypothetical protein
LMTSPLNRFRGASLVYLFSSDLICLQICRQVCTLYFSIWSRFVRSPSSMGQ